LLGRRPRIFLTLGRSNVLVLFVNTSTPSCETPDAAEARAERHLRLLQELAELGMTLARAVAARAVETGDADLGLAFTRIARAVRQTVALEAKLADEREAVRAGHIQRLAQETAARGRRRKKLVEDAVERAIDAECHGETAEALLGDLYERLVDPRDDAGFADRPIGELVAGICKALGVTPDPSLWEDEDWAIEESLLSPREARGRGKGEGGAGRPSATPRPAMTHERALARPSG
jgi:hypothetical protein